MTPIYRVQTSALAEKECVKSVVGVCSWFNQTLARWQQLQQGLWQANAPLTWSSAIAAMERGALLTRAIVRELAQFGLLYEDDDEEVGSGALFLSQQ
jgi:hypothetical protein